MADSTKRNDLRIYEPLTDPNGPGMTWCIHSIVYGDIGDYRNSDRLFEKGYMDYVKGAFKTWYEGYGDFGGVSYFITGVGGFLQSIINGYGGLRIGPDGLLIKSPRVLPNTTRLVVRRIAFMSSRLTVDVSPSFWTIVLEEGSLWSVSDTSQRIVASPAKVGEPVVLRKGDLPACFNY